MSFQDQVVTIVLDAAAEFDDVIHKPCDEENYECDDNAEEVVGDESKRKMAQKGKN